MVLFCRCILSQPKSVNTEQEAPKVSGAAGTVLLNASNLVELHYTEQQGRHIRVYIYYQNKTFKVLFQKCLTYIP